jgi:hypothetical protein
MKRWTLLIVVMTFWLLMIGIVVPLTMAAFGPVVVRPVVNTMAALIFPGYKITAAAPEEIPPLGEVLQFLASFGRMYGGWFYFVWIPLILGCQLGLLVVPVRAASARVVTRWTLIWPIMATGLLMGMLLVGMGYLVLELCATMEMQSVEWIYEPLTGQVVRDLEGGPIPVTLHEWGTIGVVVGTWLTWSLVFFRASRNRDPQNVAASQTRFLIVGSLLELTLAMVVHAISRFRGICCTGFLSYLAIVLGLSILLLSYGPGMFLLLIERLKRRTTETSAVPTNANTSAR